MRRRAVKEGITKDEAEADQGQARRSRRDHRPQVARRGRDRLAVFSRDGRRPRALRARGTAAAGATRGRRLGRKYLPRARGCDLVSVKIPIDRFTGRVNYSKLHREETMPNLLAVQLESYHDFLQVEQPAGQARGRRSGVGLPDHLPHRVDPWSSDAGVHQLHHRRAEVRHRGVPGARD